MIVVNEIHDFEEIPPQVQHFVVFGSMKRLWVSLKAFFFVFCTTFAPLVLKLSSTSCKVGISCKTICLGVNSKAKFPHRST